MEIWSPTEEILHLIIFHLGDHHRFLRRRITGRLSYSSSPSPASDRAMLHLRRSPLLCVQNGDGGVTLMVESVVEWGVYLQTRGDGRLKKIRAVTKL
ncbi:hypothetical protein Dsin_001469 [Dipteronia sinensis]|uniref:Uncharacterized protein n=1 Tax=Dipteronia sinensis TaxID=43782 RepID=A0AAE0B418_9ROSI|nr:hypothetical protein Dsin_001469 [Dipteronia sinensis]